MRGFYIRYEASINEMRAQYERAINQVVFPLKTVKCTKFNRKSIVFVRPFVVELLLFKVS